MSPEQAERLIETIERLAVALEHEHNWSEWQTPKGSKPWRQCTCSAVQYHDAEPEPPGPSCDHREKGWITARMCRSCLEFYF